MLDPFCPFGTEWLYDVWLTGYISGEPKITFDIIYDAQEAIDAYGFTVESTYYLIDQEGRKVLRFDHVDGSNFDYVFSEILDKINSLLEQ